MFAEYLSLPRLVHVLCLGSLINRAGSFAVVFLSIYASEHLGFGVAFATFCLGVFGLGSMIGSFLGGQLADRVGRRLVMLIALLGGAALLIALGAARSQWIFMATVGVFGAVVDMYRPAASAMIADVVPLNRRPHAFALMYISINLGFAIAPIVGGFLAEYSFSYLFIGDAASMALYGLIVLSLVGETKPANEVAAESPNNQVNIPFRKSLILMFQDAPFVMFCAGIF